MLYVFIGTYRGWLTAVKPPTLRCTPEPWMPTKRPPAKHEEHEGNPVTCIIDYLAMTVRNRFHTREGSSSYELLAYWAARQHLWMHFILVGYPK